MRAHFGLYCCRIAATGVFGSNPGREFRIHKPNAPVAQGTEQRTSNPPVAGSNPAGRAPDLPAKYGKMKIAPATRPAIYATYCNPLGQDAFRGAHGLALHVGQHVRVVSRVMAMVV